MVHIHCVHCSQLLQVHTENLGKNVRCPKCRQVFVAVAGEQAQHVQPTAVQPVTLPVKPAQEYHSVLPSSTRQPSFEIKEEEVPTRFEPGSTTGLTLGVFGLSILTFLLIFSIVGWHLEETWRQQRQGVIVTIKPLGYAAMVVVSLGLIVPPCVFALAAWLLWKRKGYTFLLILSYCMYGYAMILFFAAGAVSTYVSFEYVQIAVLFSWILLWLCAIGVGIGGTSIHVSLSQSKVQKLFGIERRRLRRPRQRG